MESEPNDPNVHKNTGIKRVFKAFFYSMDGLASTLKHEAAFRQEAILACVLIPISYFLNVPVVAHLILVTSILLVLMMELINSAIEAVVDDVSLVKRPLAKRAKDIGSAAVFVGLLNCFICWLTVVVMNWEQLLG